MDRRDDNHQCEQLADALPELLYGELEDTDADAVRAEASGCERCTDQLEGFEWMREMFRALPDEEPPAAITAQLLHAAAEHAKPKQRAAAAADPTRPGIWQWFAGLFRPLVAHPAAAALASLVLVGGIAGVLYMRGGAEVAQPRVDRPAAAAPEQKADEIATGATGATSAGENTATAEGEPADTASEPEPATTETETGDGMLEGRLTKTGATTPRRSRDRRGRGSAGPADNRSNITNGFEVTNTDPAPEPIESPKAPARNAPAKPRPEPRPSQQATPPPPEPPRTTESTPSFDDDTSADLAEEPAPSAPSGGGYGNDESYKRKDDTRNRAKSLHGRIAAEVARKRCKVASTLAADLRALDPAYYRDVFLRDRRLNACPNLVPRPDYDDAPTAVE